MLKLAFSGVDGRVVTAQTLTSGMVGAKVAFTFSQEWEGLQKTAVYTAGEVCIVKTDVGCEDVIPAQVLCEPLKPLFIGIYGISEDEDVAIPTIRVNVGQIQPGCNPEGDESSDDTLPVWAQIQAAIGELGGLSTTARANLVAAINEVTATNGASGATFTPSVSQDGTLSWVNNKGLENPDAVNIRGPQGEPGPQGEQGIPGAAQTPLFANSVDECTETDKVYILPDGYIYAYMKSEGSTVAPMFTNILDGTELYLNKRMNSSGNYVDAAGYVATDWLPASIGDVIRFNAPLSAHDSTYGRIHSKAGSTMYWKDGDGLYYMPFSEENNGQVTSITFGTIYNTAGNSASGTKVTTTALEYIQVNLYIGDSTITEEDVAGLAITKNEQIAYEQSSTEGYAWQNTGMAFVPADYEDRILALESNCADALDQAQQLQQQVTALQNRQTGNRVMNRIAAPCPQLPADGSETADYNAETMTAAELFDRLDALCDKYPDYIIKQTLGQDESGQYDWNRYILSPHYYTAWQRQNYPKMYGWANGDTIIYSQSVSPRIGDTMYSTPYIGTAYAAVTAVDNANSARTVNGLVFTRDALTDAEPSLVFTSILAEGAGDPVYSSGKATVTAIGQISGATLYGTDGFAYIRAPLQDRDTDMKRLPALVIGANEHGPTGDDRVPAIVCARLAEDLCHGVHGSNTALQQLRNDVMVVLVPVVNPFGFHYGSNGSALDGYYNANGVNINRNYDTPGWGNDETAGNQGDYGGSEIETQYFMNTLAQANTVAAVSVHCLGSSNRANDGLTHYQGNGFDKAKLQQIAQVMKARHGLKFTSYGTASPEIYAKSPSYITSIGAKGGIIEMNARDIHTQQLHTADVLEADYTLLLCASLMWIDDAQA